MTIKWYWPAEQMGLLWDETSYYHDGHTHYTVSAKADAVFRSLHLGLFGALSLGCFLLGFFLARRGHSKAGCWIVRSIALLLLTYNVLQVCGVFPYIEFYPSGGFSLPLEGLVNVLQLVLAGVLGGILMFTGWLGARLGSRTYTGKLVHPHQLSD